MQMKTGKFKGFHIVIGTDKRGITRHTVFLKYVPVVRFNADSANERKLAAIDLVERELCDQKTAGEICGFHRNTVFKLLRTKKLLGIEAVIEDHRGLKSPYKYIGEIRSHVKKLLRKNPDAIDQEIADQASMDLTITISRSAVARIRTEKQDKQRLPTKAELEAMAQVADAFDRSNYDKRQLELNFNWDPEIKEKCNQAGKEAAPKVDKKSDQRLIDRLQQGERFNFCGELMHHLFLQEFLQL